MRASDLLRCAKLAHVMLSSNRLLDVSRPEPLDGRLFTTRVSLVVCQRARLLQCSNDFSV